MEERNTCTLVGRYVFMVYGEYVDMWVDRGTLHGSGEFRGVSVWTTVVVERERGDTK